MFMDKELGLPSPLLWNIDGDFNYKNLFKLEIWAAGYWEHWIEKTQQRPQRKKKKKTAKHFCIIKLSCDDENNLIISVSLIC